MLIFRSKLGITSATVVSITLESVASTGEIVTTLIESIPIAIFRYHYLTLELEIRSAIPNITMKNVVGTGETVSTLTLSTVSISPLFCSSSLAG